MKIGQIFKAEDHDDSTYTVLDFVGGSVLVRRDPHPSWASPAWISVKHFAVVANLDS